MMWSTKLSAVQSLDGVKWNRTNYLASLYSDEKYERTFDRIRYFITLKRNISDVYSHKYRKRKIYSDDDLPSKKTLNIQNVVILIKSVFNKKNTIIIIMDHINNI